MGKSKLTKKQRGFANDYIDSGNGTQAALRNYDTDNPEVAKVIASENLTKPNVRQYIESKAEKAAEIVFSLATGAENETVKLNASKDILDRAGYKPVEKTQALNINIKGDVKDFNELDAIREKYELELKDKLIGETL